MLYLNQVSVAFNYQYDCTIKIFSSLSTLKIYDYDKTFKTDGNEVIFVHPLHQVILYCEAVSSQNINQESKKSFINFEYEYKPSKNKTKAN